MAVDQREAAKAIHAFLRALGRDPDRDPELRDTPARVAEAWANDLIDGYEVDVAKLLTSESSPTPGDSQGVVVYLPGPRITGLGTLSRLVDAFSHRLTLQEDIGAAVARALVHHLSVRGAACKLSLSHTCLTSRGQRQDRALVETIALAGTFEQAGPDRDLALSALSDKG